MSRLTPRGAIIHVLSFLCALGALCGLLYGAFAWLNVKLDGWPAVWEYRTVLWKGWLRTLAIAGIALPLSCTLGLLFAIARRSAFLPLQYASRIFVEVIRGTPLLVQIMLFFYVIFNLVGFDDRDVAGTLIISIFAGAYMSEIIRSGIESVGRSQLESARAIGLTRLQTYRHIIFPQAIRQILPPAAGQFVSLVKDSSLLSVIALEEFTKAAETANITTYATFECYLVLAVGYLVITLPISLWTQWLEKRVRFET